MTEQELLRPRNKACPRSREESRIGCQPVSHQRSASSHQKSADSQQPARLADSRQPIR